MLNSLVTKKALRSKNHDWLDIELMENIVVVVQIFVVVCIDQHFRVLAVSDARSWEWFETMNVVLNQIRTYTYQSLYLRTFTNIEIILLSSIELNNIIESMGKSRYQLIKVALPTAQLEVRLLHLQSWSWRCLKTNPLSVQKVTILVPIDYKSNLYVFSIKKSSKQQWIGSGNCITSVSRISPTNPLIFRHWWVKAGNILQRVYNPGIKINVVVNWVINPSISSENIK